jgi:8-oxo-dGTP pyrophosphatase MutT (NUDIX family)
MKKPDISEPIDLLRTRFLTITKFQARFGKFEKEYDVVVFGPRAGLVAVKEDKILMTKQYRFLPNSASWEIPGGTVDGGEAPDVAAQRECLEETGIYCRDLEPLLTYYPGLDNVDNRTSLFVSRNTEQARPFEPNDAEVLDIAWMPLDDIMARIARGEIMDAFTLISILGYVQFSRNGTSVRALSKTSSIEIRG